MIRCQGEKGRIRDKESRRFRVLIVQELLPKPREAEHTIPFTMFFTQQNGRSAPHAMDNDLTQNLIFIADLHV